jgi:hypothetical protein
MNEYYKQNEIYEYTIKKISKLIEIDKDYLKKEVSDIQNDIFNFDKYPYTALCEEWLDKDVFHVLETIRDYEIDKYGIVLTNLACPFDVVNMYVYIVGGYILKSIKKS